MKVVQINLNHCAAAQNLLTQSVLENNIDVAIISDPYVVPNRSDWIADQSSSVAIWTCGKYPFQHINVNVRDGYVAAKINGITFYSCYAPPRWTQTEFEDMVDKLTDDAFSNSPLVIAGDFNAWAIDWGSSFTNPRGRAVLEAFERLNVTLANVGTVTTFRRQGGSSIIDITFTSSNLIHNLGWFVSEDFTYSDHQAIFFTIDSQRNVNAQNKPNVSGWRIKDFDEALFNIAFTNAKVCTGSASDMATDLMRQLKAACDISMRRKSNFMWNKKETYWWNQDIQESRATCLRARRKSQRAYGRPHHDELVRRYKTLRHQLKLLIKESKSRCLKELINLADSNPWGKAYQLLAARSKTSSGPTETCPLLKSSSLCTQQDPCYEDIM